MSLFGTSLTSERSRSFCDALPPRQVHARLPLPDLPADEYVRELVPVGIKEDG